ncbi:MAG: hypothetical protein KF789_01520 [Bdellovibrionaceae bacterium]|nr:hypothetical protein [Pseudobdellovibrionaceae bacterium]
MKKLIPGFLCLVVLAAGGTLLYSRLQPSLESKEPVFRTVQAVPEEEAALQFPPSGAGEGDFAIVNRDRLEKLAGQPYDGPSYAISVVEMNQMVAEAKLNHASGNRLPANATPEPVQKKKRK